MLQLASSARAFNVQRSTFKRSTLNAQPQLPFPYAESCLNVMDVPFSASGAMSRAHYALVRKIEAATPQAADQLLLAEVDRIRHHLARSTLTLCKENLILLLYCAMTVNPGVHVDLQFALPHAINLAEAGQTVQDKRTGYLFCAEVMPAEHELQLMLVNSVRKV
ncbi:hypothetical protein BN946_scf185002.g118 [Trametes cinnabarina]|uniref:Uncharacterized protein n=1 Tax=Pycnoporus cinnabarinus TaxID=5643 RepID=A0A060SKI7_PYCCI|nr:hypothetical protein BN946_scf185002.g118 [Trametes cinnabarina]